MNINAFCRAIALMAMVCFHVGVVAQAAEDLRPGDYVDPLIGNLPPRLVPNWPTFSRPNQMLRMVPLKGDYIDEQVTGFPLQNMAHRKPGLFQLRAFVGDIGADTWKRRMTIDHDRSDLHPWYYSTVLTEDDITVSFAPGRRAAIYRFDFPATGKRNILIAGTPAMTMEQIHGHAFSLTERYVATSKLPELTTSSMTVYCAAQLTDLQGRPLTDITLQGKSGRMVITLGEREPASVLIKYAISYIDQQQARATFEEEVAKADLNQLANEARRDWERVLGRIQVEGGTVGQRRTFYTALYRTHERMVDINEGGRYFSGYDHQVHATDRAFYVDDWIWDTFRALHPLRTILDPAMQSDVLNSYTEMSRQSGWMPTFPQVSGNHQCMNCYHSASIFLDGWRKGIRGFDMEQAYGAIRKNLTSGTWIPWRQGNAPTGIDKDMEILGYVPALRPEETETEPLVDGFEKRQAVAVSLGRSFDAWTLSALAEDLNKHDDHEKFANMAKDYTKLWHPEKRLFIPKDAQGQWLNIDPKLAGGKGFRAYYDENNGWTYAWLVLHDLPGLFKLIGGNAATVDRLDQMFRESLGMDRAEFAFNHSDSSSMVGQFSMGNEPSFHIPYLYNYVGAPWKTQHRTRFLLDLWFKDNVFGTPGDEDGGGMTAWVVFTSLGLYQVTPGIPLFTITSPVFTESAISLPGSKTFRIRAPHTSVRNKFIQKATLEGRPLPGPFLTYQQVMSGGVLELEMGDKPNFSWGVAGAPALP